MFYRLPANRFFVWLDTLSSFQFSKIESTCAMKGLLDDKVLTLRFSAVETNTSEAIIELCEGIVIKNGPDALTNGNGRSNWI